MLPWPIWLAFNILPLGIKYIVPEKSIPDIFNCNLKTNYQILIIFGTNIPDSQKCLGYFY